LYTGRGKETRGEEGKDSHNSKKKMEEDKIKKSKGRKEKKGKKVKKKRKERKKESSSSSSSSEEAESSTSSSSSGGFSSSSSTSSSSSSGSGKGKERNKRESKKRRVNEKNWELLRDMWPVETRPGHLQKKKNTMGMTLDMLLRCKEQYEKEAEKKGMGKAVYGRDGRVRKKVFKKMKDDGMKKLHPARWERLPVVEPKKYWGQLPTKRDQIFRHIPLQHYGLDGQISELTLVRMHDRKVPVELEMLTRDKVTEVRHCMDAVVNHAIVCQTLWPTDYGPMVIMKVLVDVMWGEGLSFNEKQKVAAIKRMFDDVARENSGRAVRKEAPLDYDKVRARYTESACRLSTHIK
jgi:hypothetical protein